MSLERPRNWFAKEKGDKHTMARWPIRRSSRRHLEKQGVQRSLDRLFGSKRGKKGK